MFSDEIGLRMVFFKLKNGSISPTGVRNNEENLSRPCLPPWACGDLQQSSKKFACCAWALTVFSRYVYEQDIERLDSFTGGRLEAGIVGPTSCLTNDVAWA